MNNLPKVHTDRLFDIVFDCTFKDSIKETRACQIMLSPESMNELACVYLAPSENKGLMPVIFFSIVRDGKQPIRAEATGWEGPVVNVTNVRLVKHLATKGLNIKRALNYFMSADCVPEMKASIEYELRKRAHGISFKPTRTERLVAPGRLVKR